MNLKQQLSYPGMRLELIEHLEDLADVRTIAEGGGTAGSLLDLAVHFLFDDTNLEGDIEGAVGEFLLDDIEAKAVGRVVNALSGVFEKHGTRMEDRDYTNLPEWSEVLDSAQKAHTLLVSSGGSTSSQ